jgi:Ser-tRNA(Ala) deacylase AlaX
LAYLTHQALFDVVLEDTVLFPEGGGQPSDRGTVGGVECVAVENVDGIAVHVVTAPLEEGSQVDVQVDWNRRWDHCTQHSMQATISQKC